MQRTPVLPVHRPAVTRLSPVCCRIIACSQIVRLFEAILTTRESNFAESRLFVRHFSLQVFYFELI